MQRRSFFASAALSALLVLGMTAGQAMADATDVPAPGKSKKIDAIKARYSKALTWKATVWASIGQFFSRRLAALQAAGIGRDRLIIDPGLGYFLGSNPEPSLLALAGIRALKSRFGLPVLVCPSRKSFLRTLTGKDSAQAGPATLAAEIFAAWQGADYIRTHDVTALRDALTVLGAVASQSLKCLPHQGEPHQPAEVAEPYQ